MGRYYRRRYRRKSNADNLGAIIIGLFYIGILPIYLLIILIKTIVKYNKKQNKPEKHIINNIDNTNYKKYYILKYSILIIAIMLFILFLYFAYGLKADGEHTPICLILSICCFITFGILSKRKFNNEIDNNNFNNDKFESLETNQTIIEHSKYHLKSKTITDNEKYFLDIINKHFSKDYDIRVQVPLASIIEKEKDFESQYQNELNRIIDIGIFDKDTSYPLLLIEINDGTHHRKDRQVRDAKVKNICEQAGIKLIAFWTEYSNTEEYIFNRVNTNLGDSN